MSTARRTRLTVAEYLARENAALEKSEYYRGEMFSMAGVSYAHTLIARNTLVALTIALRGKPCQPLGSDQRVWTADDFITYPDISIHCDQPRFDDQRPESLLNPRVLIEVLSDSTEAYDRGKKFELYQVIPSFREYLLIAQDRIRIERFVRQDDGDWKLSSFVDPTALIDLASVGCALRVADVYAGIEFPVI